MTAPLPLAAPDRAAKTPVCTICNDTHSMVLHRDGDADRVVMCTRCPVPCQRCRADGNGPFCETTPCPCECHRSGVAVRRDDPHPPSDPTCMQCGDQQSTHDDVNRCPPITRRMLACLRGEHEPEPVHVPAPEHGIDVTRLWPLPACRWCRAVFAPRSE